MISVWVYLQKQHANPNPESKFAKKRPKLNGLKDMDILLMVPVMYSGMIRRIALGLSAQTPRSKFVTDSSLGSSSRAASLCFSCHSIVADRAFRWRIVAAHDLAPGQMIRLQSFRSRRQNRRIVWYRAWCIYLLSSTLESDSAKFLVE